MKGGTVRSARAAHAVAVAILLAGCGAGRTVVAPNPVLQRPTPTPTPTATPPEPPLTPVAVPASAIPERPDLRPPVVRVLLQAPAEPLLVEPGRRYVCIVGEGPVVLRGPLTVTALQGRAAIQVGAFTQDANAQALLVRLVATGFEGQVTDLGDELRRVVAFVRSGETEDTLAQRLRQAGFNEQRKSATAAVGVVVRGEGDAAVQGPRVRVVPLDLDPVRVGTKAVRGELELRPAASGVAVINVVGLEEYLRGVVPAEMGPRAFPLLEAQKAQAVAARTYAVAHLGEHAANGYDLCDSQLCQVYGGADAENPLSDRAVAETAGEILTWQGRPIDAMYHSTCAGHTEDGAAVFPQRAEPYLKGVRCRGERSLAAGVAPSAGPWLSEIERLAAVGGRIARSLGVPAQPKALAARLTGVQPGAGVAGLERAFGLDRAAAAIHVASGSTSEESALELLRQYRLPLPPPPRGAGRALWEMAVAVRLGQLAGPIQAVGGRIVPGPSGIRLVTEGAELSKDLTGHETLLERRGERWRLNSMEFPAGSAATLWCAGETCPLFEVEPLDDADAGSAWTWWVREIPLEELGRKLSVAGAREVTVARRGVSGRALTVVVAGTEGRREIGGLSFRRALDLPDTLFEVVPLRSGKSPAVRFLGRGWGHGVGMCQNGAYGLARGGWSYIEILKKYYTGVELARWGGETHEHNSEAGLRGP